jgi:hypothetical protein
MVTPSGTRRLDGNFFRYTKRQNGNSIRYIRDIEWELLQVHQDRMGTPLGTLRQNGNSFRYTKTGWELFRYTKTEIY